MNRKKLLEKINKWIENAPLSAEFGYVDDIESEDNVIQIYY